MKNFGNILWGIVFITVGLIFGLNAMGITNINIFFNGWWTLFIIIPCLISYIKQPTKWGNLVGILIGILLLLASQKIITFEVIWKMIIPMIFILIGLGMIFGNAINKKVNEKIKELNKTCEEEYCATFAGQEIKLDEEELKNISVNAIFGGIDIDASNAIVSEDKIINVSAIFGGVDIKVPRNVNVKVKSTPIFGGVDSKIKNTNDANIPTIYVNAFCLFGGADIK